MKIVVRGTNWIGDAVMTIPALRALRSRLPDAELTLLTHKRTIDIFQDTDTVDRILPLETDGGRILNVVRTARKLRRERFDIGILLANSFEAALTFKLAGVSKVFGYANEGRRLLITNPASVPEWKSKRHEVYYYLELIAIVEENLLGQRVQSIDDEPDISLSVSQQNKDGARTILKSHGIDAGSHLVGLGVGSTNSRAKRWPVRSYAALAERLNEETGASIVLLGSQADAPIACEILALSRLPIIDLTGKTTMGEAIGILSELDLLISNDMGLAHIAPTVGTGTLVIFGPTDPVTTRPYSARSEVIRNGVECSPCMLRDCPIDHRCMVNISVEEVAAKALSKLHINE